MFAFGFAISQGGIAARTPTRMLGSEVKERKETTANIPNRVTYKTAIAENRTRTRKAGDAWPYHYTVEKLRYNCQNAVFNL